MKKLLFISSLLLSVVYSYSQELRLKVGGITDSISVVNMKDATFSLYLPLDYTPDKEWPVIFVFDSQGRGRASANLFKSAAEEQQYVIASSNIDMTSEPVDSIVKKATWMVNSVTSLLPVDKTMVYAAGMSNGAQVASALPLIFNKINGILAVGNSFVNPKYINKNSPYMFVGVAGRKDYMIYEMEEYLKFYDKIDFPADIYYFDGKEDEWPEISVITNAVNSFTLQAIRNGLRPADPEFIRSVFDNELADVESIRRKMQYYYAFEKLERMEEKYDDFGYEDEIEELKKAIKKDPNFRSQRRDFRQATSFEKMQQEEYEYLLQTDLVTANFQNIGWWAYQVDELNKLKESTNIFQANMAYRLHGYLDFITKQEFKNIVNSPAPIDAKIFASVLRTAIDKEDPEAYLKIISLAGADGDYETALLYLEDLLKTGYSDMEALYNIEGALDLQFTEEYNDLIKKYLGKSKFYNE